MKPVAIFGWAIGAFGVAFLMLGLVAAIREIFPSTERIEQIARNGTSAEELVSLLSTVDKLKTWLALAVVGTTLLLVAISTPALERWLDREPTQTQAAGKKS